MAGYRIIFKRSVLSDLRSIPHKDVARILSRIDALADTPRGPGCEKLSGREWYRVRQGNYRILYEVRDLEILIVIVKVAHRREVYRG